MSIKHLYANFIMQLGNNTIIYYLCGYCQHIQCQEICYDTLYIHILFNLTLSPCPAPPYWVGLVFQFYRRRERIEDIKQLTKGHTFVGKISRHLNSGIFKPLDESNTQTS